MAAMTAAATANQQYYNNYPSVDNQAYHHHQQQYGHHTYHHQQVTNLHQLELPQQQQTSQHHHLHNQQPYQHHGTGNQHNQQQLISTHHQQQQHHHHAMAASGQTNLIHLGQHQAATRTVSATSITNSNSPANSTNLYSIEATKSTKGASKLRRDLISHEIVRLRELLPIPELPQKVSQLQLMALVLVYVRKSNYFCNAFGKYGITREPSASIPTGGFTKALNGFIMMLTQKGKLLYISDNAAEHLGHSMEDILSHGDEVYDIIEDQDKKIIRGELLSNDESQGNNSMQQHQDISSSNSSASSTSSSLHSPSSHLNQINSNNNPMMPSNETKIALCRMNVSKNRQSRRQMRFGDQKVVLIEGHYFGHLPLSSRDEPVFWATCTPVAMPETRECVVQGSTNVFNSIHSMDMKFLYVDGIGEHYLGCNKQQIHNLSWYQLVHFDFLQEAQAKHRRLTSNYCSAAANNEQAQQLQERSTILLLKLFNFDQTKTIWVHSVMKVKEATDSSSQPVIVCTNQVLSEREAQVMRSNQWLYQFYSSSSITATPSSKLVPDFSSIQPQPASSPQSVCSSDEQSTIIEQSALKGGDSNAKMNSISGTIRLPGSNDLSKSPPADNSINGKLQTVGPIKAASVVAATGVNSTKLAAGSPANFKLATNNQSGAASNSFELMQFNQDNQYYSNNFDQNQKPLIQANNSKNLSGNSKLSPLNHSPTSSTISSSPLSTSSSSLTMAINNYQQPIIGTNLHSTRYNNASELMHQQQQQQQHFPGHQHHHYQTNHQHSGSVGSSSASSTSSTSSSSSGSASQGADFLLATPPSNGSTNAKASGLVNNGTVAAAAAAAVGLYAGIDAIATSHHPDGQSMYQHQGQTNHVAASNPSSAAHLPVETGKVHHAAAAVNYANQVMAAQRVAAQQHHHHHHHPYHPYHHHQHHPIVHHHQSSQHHLAPHHHAAASHHHHSAASFYHHGAPNHVAATAAAASTAALSSAYHHHHAAYHSTAAAAAVAAVTSAAHPAHHNYVNYLNVN